MTPQAERWARTHTSAAVSTRAGRTPDAPGRAARPTPERAPLRVLDARELVRRAQRRTVARLVAMSIVVVAVALLVVAGAQAFVAERQLRIDNLEQQLTAAVARSQSLQLSRAELSSPSRVLAVAEHTLKMVAPPSIYYVRPVQPGPSVASVARSVAIPAPTLVPERAAAHLTRP